MFAGLFRFKLLGAVAVGLSALLTVIILLAVWSWLNPIDFWAKIVALILAILGGVVLFIAITLVIGFLMLAIFMLIFRRKLRKAFKKFENIETAGYE